MYIFNAFYLLHSYNPSFFICLCFNMVSFNGQKKLKISDEHPHPFHMRSPLPPGGGGGKPHLAKNSTLTGNHKTMLQLLLVFLATGG